MCIAVAILFDSSFILIRPILYLHNPGIPSVCQDSITHSLTHSLTRRLFINITINNHNVFSILPTPNRRRTWLSFFFSPSFPPTPTTDNTKLLPTNIHLLRLLDLLIIYILIFFLHVRLPTPVLNGSTTTTTSRRPPLLKMCKMRRDNQRPKKW
jgi:hypothetical protein